MSESRNPDRGTVPLDRIRIEPMRVRDLDEVLLIEQTSFPTPWSRLAYHRELMVNDYATYLVGRLDGRIVSYGGMWVILDESHITNIAVHPDYRRLGVGRLTMLALESKARELGASRMTLEVRTSNLEARRLYEGLGYHGTGVRRNYYSDTHEDAIVMWKDLGPPEAVPTEGVP